MFMRNIKSAVFFLCYVLGFVVRVIAAYWKSWMEFRWSFVVWKRLFRIGANVFKHLIEFPSKVCLAAVCRLLGERPNLVGGHILCVFKCSFERRPLNHGALLPPSGQILATSQFWLCCDRETQSSSNTQIKSTVPFEFGRFRWPVSFGEDPSQDGATQLRENCVGTVSW